MSWALDRQWKRIADSGRTICITSITLHYKFWSAYPCRVHVYSVQKCVLISACNVSCNRDLSYLEKLTWLTYSWRRKIRYKIALIKYKAKSTVIATYTWRLCWTVALMMGIASFWQELVNCTTDVACVVGKSFLTSQLTIWYWLSDDGKDSELISTCRWLKTELLRMA